MLNDEQKKCLLEIAVNSISAVISKTAPRAVDTTIDGSDRGGVFVTLRTYNRLRGCMGTFQTPIDLAKTVRDVAMSSASDPRFRGSPIQPHDLGSLEIELSILSKPKVTEDPLSLEVGKHGIAIEHANGRGCFLPHVATELGWSAHEFLSRCCQDKAGLSADAWQDSKTKVLLFTAEIILNTKH